MNWMYAATLGLIVAVGFIVWIVRLAKKADKVGALKHEIDKLNKIDKMENDYDAQLAEAKRRFIDNYHD